MVRSRYARGAVEQWRYNRGKLVVRFQFGALPVRCVSLTFQRAILYYMYYVYMYV